MTDMPESLQRLVASVTSSFHIVANHSSTGAGRPSVWEVKGSAGRRWFAKQNPGPKLHRREVHAYQLGWPAALGWDRSPALEAVDDEARAIVITAVPGRAVRNLRLDSEEEREVYRQAGLLLARFNAAETGESEPTRTASWGESVRKMLAGAALHLTFDDVAMLRWFTRDAPAELPRLVSHGDFMPRNWLWDETEHRLRIIDFERTCIESAMCRDFSRLSFRILRGRPDLEAAFQAGYGRTLTTEEHQACSAYAAFDAVSALCWGIDHHDIEFVDEAHIMLRHLQAEYSGLIRRDATR